MTTAQAVSAPRETIRTLNAGATLLAAVSGIGIAYAVALTIMCARHIWNFDAHGRPIVNDFVSFWSAGRLALHGHALAAYDPLLRHSAEIATVGHPFKDIIGWWYPPLFLFVASALACIPYATAFVVMNDATLLLHAGVTGLIAKRRAASFLVAFPPWAMLGMVHGQNQFLTASLVGAVLLTLEERPALSGLLLGLLSYKPQLGLLFPVALAFGGYWRSFAWTCAGTVLWTALSGAVFGFDTFAAFVHGLSTVSQRILVTNPDYLSNLQNLYALARWVGVPDRASWIMQSCLSIACAIAIAGLWRSRAPFALKAAGLAVAIPLATPYIFVYDLTLLSVALAFLYRDRRFDRLEWSVVAFAIVTVGIFGWGKADPAGFPVCAAVAAAILRRVYRSSGIGIPAGARLELTLLPSPASPASS